MKNQYENLILEVTLLYFVLKQIESLYVFGFQQVFVAKQDKYSCAITSQPILFLCLPVGFQQFLSLWSEVFGQWLLNGIGDGPVKLHLAISNDRKLF